MKVTPRWFCERCKKWYNGYPPLNCPKTYEKREETVIQNANKN